MVGGVADAVTDVATGTRDAVVTGVCFGVGATVMGAQAVGKGTKAIGGAVVDGATAVGLFLSFETLNN